MYIYIYTHYCMYIYIYILQRRTLTQIPMKTLVTTLVNSVLFTIPRLTPKNRSQMAIKKAGHFQ